MTKPLEENEATGKAKAIYEEIRKSFGMVPNVFKAQGVHDKIVGERSVKKSVAQPRKRSGLCHTSLVPP